MNTDGRNKAEIVAKPELAIANAASTLCRTPYRAKKLNNIGDKRKMKLNKIEFMLMNNPLRAFIQDKYEVKILRSMSSIKNIETALEIGCGNGNGTKVIVKLFSPKNIIAIDLDEKMIEIAQRRNKDKSVTYKVMDASKLDFPNNHFDAVFDFGIIHHIPNWKDCIQELKRVLKTNGEVILEELSIDTFSKGIGRVWRKILDHPYKHMYSAKQFTEFMTETGFEIEHYKESNPFKLMRHFSLNAIRKKEWHGQACNQSVE